MNAAHTPAELAAIEAGNLNRVLGSHKGKATYWRAQCMEARSQRNELAAALAAVYALRSGIINEANKNGTRFTPGTDRVDHFAEAFTKARAALAEAGVKS